VEPVLSVAESIFARNALGFGLRAFCFDRDLLMPQLFAATRAFGPGWNRSLPLEQQQDWRVQAEVYERAKGR
jgi:hypothetical protein